MQAVIELTMSIVSALAVAILAQFGVDQAPKEPARAERVVARSPQARPPVAPRHAIDCPDARAAALSVA